ncbi:Chromosome III, complete sequence, related [Eimeria necatrix]|uniref:Chromosome III, complete sequence, related n=1 Tax=Eimeria necatrix TaxID=51315 RepID=U6MP42_9EIME|nr:Chromosome III, complete sequence, related [Eimeria necatrix]CDJ64229.1 Chromosome III, complete sequence, related [Eimeria necatrix]
MQQPTDCKGLSHEVPHEALTAFPQPLRPSLCPTPQQQPQQQQLLLLLQQQQQRLAATGEALREPMLAAVPAPLPVPSLVTQGAFSLSLQGQQQQQQQQQPQQQQPLLLLLPGAGCHDASGPQASPLWGPSEAHRELPQGAPTQAFATPETCGSSSSGSSSSSSSSSVSSNNTMAPLLPVKAPPEFEAACNPPPLVRAQDSFPANPWNPLAPHNLSSAAAVAASAAACPSPATVSLAEGIPEATQRPQQSSVASQEAEPSHSRETLIQQPQREQQSLLQQLHQSEQLQQQLLRSLQQQQQQQQRWRHLLEACQGPPLGSPISVLSASASPASFPAAVAHFPAVLPFQQQQQQQLLQRQLPQTGIVASMHPTGLVCEKSTSPAPAQQQQQQQQLPSDQGWVNAMPPVGSRANTTWPNFYSSNHEGLGARSQPPADARAAAPAVWTQESAATKLWSNTIPKSSPLQHLNHQMAHPTGPLEPSRVPAAGLLSSGAPTNLLQPPTGDWQRGIAGGATELHPANTAASASVAATEAAAAAPSGAIAETTGAEATDLPVGEDSVGPQIAAPLGIRYSKGGPYVRSKEGVSSRRRGGRRVCGKRGAQLFEPKPTAAARPEAKSGGLLGSSRSPSVARTAACSVLGFGAVMPPQTRLATAPAIGLINLGGGSCFLNVVLQYLAHVQPLRDFYLNYATMLPSLDLLGSQYEAYTSYLETSRQHVRRLKRGPHHLIQTPTYTTSVTWELAVVINHMWRSPSSVRFIKPEALYQVCCRIMPDFDPREMQDSDEFLRLLLDFLDGELRAAATGVPLQKALMLQAMPRRLDTCPPFSQGFGQSQGPACPLPAPHPGLKELKDDVKEAKMQGDTNTSNELGTSGAGWNGTSAKDDEPPACGDLPTLFSVFFEGAEVDKVRCTNCGRCTSTLVPFKSLAVAMTREAQEESCQHASLRLKPSSFLHLLSKVSLVECLDRHFADDCESLKLSSGEGYFCEHCDSKQDAVKSCALVEGHLPFVLCLTLKRFVRGRQTYKIWNPVQFGEYVDLASYVERSNAGAATAEAAAFPNADQTAVAESAQATAMSVPTPGFEGVDGARYTLASEKGKGFPGVSSKASTAVDAFEAELIERSESREGLFPSPAPCSVAVGSGEPVETRQAQTAGEDECRPTDADRQPRSHSGAGGSSASPALSSGYGYKLVALVEHEGPATEQGHYVCYIKHMDSDSWFRADDKVVEPVDLQRVLAASPYILFYQRLPGSPEGDSDPAKGPSRGAEGSEPQAEADAVNLPRFKKGFAGLKEQLAIANSLSKGQWPQWQDLIGRKFGHDAAPSTGDKPRISGVEMDHAASWDSGS